MILSPLETKAIAKGYPFIGTTGLAELYVMSIIMKSPDAECFDINTSKAILDFVITSLVERGWHVRVDNNANGFRVYFSDNQDRIRGCGKVWVPS